MRAWFLLLLVVPTAAAQVDLQLPDGFRLSEATFLAGSVRLEQALLRDPVVAHPRSASFAGTLTVCPNAADPQGVVRPVLLSTLATVRPDCSNGRVFNDPVLTFGPGTRLAFGGELAIAEMPGGALVAPFAGEPPTLAMAVGGGRSPLVWAPLDSATAFAAVSSTSNVTVANATPPVSFTGTTAVFLVETAALRIDAAAVAATLASQLRATVVAASRSDIAQALEDPFALLDAQEDLLGPEAREPRGNVSAVLREFGRTPDYVNGALFGRLNGTIGAQRFGADVALARGERFELRQDGRTLSGEGTSQVAIVPAGVAIGASGPVAAPWLWFIVAWLVALGVLLVRRRVPARPGWMAFVWLTSFLLALAVYDLVVLQGTFGTGLLRDTTFDQGTGSLLSQAAFILVMFAAWFLALALPVRLVLGRILPRRALLFAEPAWAIVWALLPLVVPASVFALGYFLARL